ncbi:hypothetical protein OESDEN_14637 [Oesophagostomum dentatum]|uniref:ZP domain-containing protein n=1 Tax=Oesophagostomum dentatum TaxID=61180 RepID=A0A0B1SQ82_OESDE|nr:hypothetical protein OESDEN_14637 [Oesophagostomum dentatum]
MKNALQMVDQMENRVYVQMEKDAQTASDRQFLFVCQLADAKDEKELSDFSVRRHPIGPVADSGSYVIPPEGAGQMPFLMHNAIEPVKSNTVPRVSAFSSDGHLGNWPIPGAHPYTPGDRPVAPWPKLPLPDPIIPVNRPSGGARIADEYPVVSKPLPTTTPKNPFLPPAPTPTIVQVIPARDIPRPVSDFLDKQIGVSRKPIEPVKTFFTVRAPLEVIHPTSGVPRIPALPTASTPVMNVGYVLPDATITGNEIDTAMISGNRVMYKGKATEIPAYPWNRPYPGSDLIVQKPKDTVPTEIPDTIFRAAASVGKHTEGHDKAKTFKEEPPRIGVEFRTDGGNKVTSAEDVSASRLVSTQEYLAPAPEMSLEIQHGLGPFAPTVSAPVKIGDNITLVVRSKSQMRGEDVYDMFVHSCFASDGPGSTKIDLIDKNGCAIRPQFVSTMNRTKDPAGMMYYFFRITAFKFPGPDDVYFSCSIEITPFRNAPVGFWLTCSAVRTATLL